MNARKLVVCVLLLLAVVCGCQQDGKKKLTQKEEAQKKWRDARAAVLTSLAKSQYESGNIDQCRQTVAEALKLQPESAPLHVLNAKVLIENSKLELAESELQRARELDTTNAEADYLSGVIYQRWQKNEQAYDYYTRACDKNDTELAYLLARAETLVALGRTPEAYQCLQDKVAFFEHNAVLRHMMGQLLVDLERYPEAIDSLRRASILATDDPGIREDLGMALFYNRQYREAGDIFGRLLKDDKLAKRADLWIAQGECQMQIGRPGEARASFDTATQLNPASSAAWLSLGKAALQLGDTRRAEIVLHKAISLDPGSAEAHLMLGYIRLRQDKVNDALVEFQKAAALDRTDPVSLCMIGYVYEKNGKPQQALKYYSQALKVKPGDELATQLMASVDVSE